MSDEIVRVFVGSDRSQELAVKVLEYSIKRHTDMEVEVTSMTSVKLPEPHDLRQGSRTNFSFTRFAIPRLCGYEGRAIYMDADMQVFKDIRELWTVPFEGCKVNILEEVPEEYQPKEGQLGAPKKRKKQSSVMLLDCGRLDWVPEDIIAGLDGEYTYDELLSDLCILEPQEVGYKVPWVWNSLEVHVPGMTALTHYTDMLIQPWVSPENPIGWVWLNEVRRMLVDGSLTWDEIQTEIDLGYFRPSLILDMNLAKDLSKLTRKDVQKRLDYDAERNFVKHAEVYERKRARKRAIKEFEMREERERASA